MPIKKRSGTIQNSRRHLQCRLFEFMRKINDASNVRSTECYHKFGHACRNFRKSSKNKSMFLSYASRCIASTFAPHLNSRLPVLGRRFISTTVLADSVASPASSATSQASPPLSLAMSVNDNIQDS